MIGALASRLARSLPVLALAACSLPPSAPARAQRLDTSAFENTVVIDGRAVPTHGQHRLLDILRLHRKAARLGLAARDPREGPLVVWNGVPLLDGLSVLADTHVMDVATVTLLTGPEAFWRYGQRAGRGAVVVESRRGGPGRVSDRPARPSRRPTPAPQRITAMAMPS
jgi:hypothetical protein